VLEFADHQADGGLAGAPFVAPCPIRAKTPSEIDSSQMRRGIHRVQRLGISQEVTKSSGAPGNTEGPGSGGSTFGASHRSLKTPKALSTWPMLDGCIRLGCEVAQSLENPSSGLHVIGSRGGGKATRRIGHGLV
jgi:hypothetical protein